MTDPTTTPQRVSEERLREIISLASQTDAGNSRGARDKRDVLSALNELLASRPALEAVWRWRMKGTRGDALPEPIADLVRAAILPPPKEPRDG